jgi:VIT1/CCC1 family predicted Fe2+/Mn2+ transporter
VNGTQVIIVAGLAEIAAGSIAMGLGGYLAAKSDSEHYESERKREAVEVVELPHEEIRETKEILGGYGLTGPEVDTIIARFQANHKDWVDWMMRFELGLEEPDPNRALKSALTIAGSYIVGGLIPLGPYFFNSVPQTALWWSVTATLSALAAFGYMKGTFTGIHPWMSALRTAVIGGLAAAAAFGIAKAIS